MQRFQLKQKINAKKLMKKFIPFITVFLILILDQALKIWVKTNMQLGEEFSVAGDWFYFHFIENEGMAFGWIFPGENGKLFLTLFRLIAVGFLSYYIYYLYRKKASKGALISISLILAGALGNILDSAFYGVLFTESNILTVAQLAGEAKGYASLFHGNVVDMFYFPLWNGYFPEWLPKWGGEPFQFFRPVFNIADASITTGVSLILLFQKRFFENTENQSSINSNLLSVVEDEQIELLSVVGDEEE